MRAEPFSLGGMPALRWGRPSRQGILYLHGQGGSKAVAAFFAAAAADAGWQTVSVDPVSYTHLTLPTILLV